MKIDEVKETSIDVVNLVGCCLHVGRNFSAVGNVVASEMSGGDDE